MKYLAMRLCVSLDSLNIQPDKGYKEMMSCEGVGGSKHIPFPFLILLLFIVYSYCCFTSFIILFSSISGQVIPNQAQMLFILISASVSDKLQANDNDILANSFFPQLSKITVPHPPKHYTAS